MLWHQRFSNLLKSISNLNINYQQCRNTFVLRRVHKPLLLKRGEKFRKMTNKYFIYEIQDIIGVKPHPKISLILTDYVPEVGDRGDIIEAKTFTAYYKYLLPGLAVYNTPENIAKHKFDMDVKKRKFSSLFVEKTINNLSKVIIYITMNKTHDWILEPWHIKTAFRQNLIEVPEYAIEMPPGEIRGPDPSLEKKEFYVIITINKTEKVYVRCRIHQYDKGSEIPSTPWDIKLEPLFSEQADKLSQMPLVEFNI